MWRGVHTGGALFALAVASCGDPVPSQATTGGLPHNTRAPRNTVTLITGDRVTLSSAGGARSPAIQRGPGRDRIEFSIREDDGELTVLPIDAAPLVATGQLDPALFNVTRLLADGHGDDRRDDVPLIITGSSDMPALGRRMASPDVTVVRTLPALHAMGRRPDRRWRP